MVSEKAKASMLEAMERGLQREEKDPLIPDSARHLKAAWTTLNVMRQAPVTIFIVNPLGIDLRKAITAEERIYEICNAQSIGANIENMTLTATDLGLGSLWICDTYFAYDELMEWLNMEGTLVAAIVLGYADESPVARPRKAVFEIVEWRE